MQNGIFLSQAMQMAGITQAQLADAAGISQGTISRYLNAKAAPKADELLRIARVLNVTMEWLLTGQGPMPPSPAPQAGGLKEARAEAARLERLLGEAEASSARLRSFLG